MTLFEREAERILSEVIDVTANPLNKPAASTQTSTQPGKPQPTQKSKVPGKAPVNPLLLAIQNLEASGVASSQEIFAHPQIAPLLKSNPAAALAMLKKFAQQRALQVAQNAKKAVSNI